MVPGQAGRPVRLEYSGGFVAPIRTEANDHESWDYECARGEIATKIAQIQDGHARRSVSTALKLNGSTDAANSASSRQARSRSR
jgi:hypothetical protein